MKHLILIERLMREARSDNRIVRLKAKLLLMLN